MAMDDKYYINITEFSKLVSLINKDQLSFI